jgi:hypothetical protein
MTIGVLLQLVQAGTMSPSKSGDAILAVSLEPGRVCVGYVDSVHNLR